MPQPEEVDEINEYLRQRHIKQEKGELPKLDYSPSIFRKIKSAIWGKEPEVHKILQSEQQTNASPIADAAMRKQIEEAMVPKPATPPAKTFVVPLANASYVPPASSKAAPPAPMPRAPYPTASPTSSSSSSVLTAPPLKPSIWSKFSRIQNEMKRPSSFSLTNKENSPGMVYPSPSTLPPRPTNTSPADYSPKSLSTAPANATAASSALKTENPSASDASLVASMEEVSPSDIAPATDSPPWVQRRVGQNPGMQTIGELNRAAKENALPWEPKEERGSLSSDISPYTGKLSAPMPEKKEEGISISEAPPASETKPLPPKPWVSGEINMRDELKSKPSPFGAEKEKEKESEDTIKEEEITEEEALEQLPFEDVEGLSQSDLDYLDKKEREHREQRKKLEEDTITPQELKERLQSQEVRMESILKDEAPRSVRPATTTPSFMAPRPPIPPKPPTPVRAVPAPPAPRPIYPSFSAPMTPASSSPTPPAPTPPKPTPSSPPAAAPSTPSSTPSTPTLSSPEKQEILRRLKEMMQKEDHSA